MSTKNTFPEIGYLEVLAQDADGGQAPELVEDLTDPIGRMVAVAGEFGPPATDAEIGRCAELAGWTVVRSAAIDLRLLGRIADAQVLEGWCDRNAPEGVR